MKKIKNLYLFLLPLLSPFLISALPTSNYYLSSSVYGPFSAYEKNQTLVFSVRSNLLISQNVYAEMSIFNAQMNIVSKSRSLTVAISKYNSQTLSVEFVTNYFLSPNGMKALFTLVDANTLNQLIASNFSLYPAKERIINPTEHNESSIEFEPTCFAFCNSGIITYHEKYQFNQFYDYFLIDTYYRLLIDQFTFNYYFLKDLTYQTAKLHFSIDEQLFPYISYEENNEIAIPLQLVKENGSYHFCYLETMYVNPLTLQMSLTPLPQFVATSYFYLPKNGMNILQNKKFYFTLTGLGQNNVTFEWSASLLTENNLLGPCFDSDYCVIGGIAR